MQTRPMLLLGLLVAGALAAGWRMSSSRPLPAVAARPSPPARKPAVQSAPAQPPSPALPTALAPVPAPVAPVVEAKPAAEAEKKSYPPPISPMALDVRKQYAEELEQVGLMLRDYRTLMRENPVGTNAEIMAALMGGNPKHARLGPAGGEGLNEKGELMDRWGTPYFFHQMSATVMEIHSAGPDKKMWTSDDVVVK
ncbi:hypothetical protein [Prosthecobacter sp.]|uniref:hypothetical protein n=1 Tax=Prosthecobacter sp. TaxID=1965333 RepID=UPI003783B341